MGDKSGIRRFYRRVWKNIFYERRDKERKREFLGMGEDGERGEGEFIFFLKIFKGVGKSSKFYRGNVFLGLWGGERKNRERIGFLGYVWEGM